MLSTLELVIAIYIGVTLASLGKAATSWIWKVIKPDVDGAPPLLVLIQAVILLILPTTFILVALGVLFDTQTNG